jgi:hypothetical protein
MELLEGKALSKLILERYSKSPRNWSFTVSPSPKDGYFDAVIGNREEVWQVKLDSIFKPSPFMLGAKADVDPLKVQKLSSVSYGYRKLEPKVLMQILESFSEQDDYETQDRRTPYKSFDSLLASLETVTPTPSGSYAEGPFVLTDRKANIVSDSQKKLDDKLHLEMRKLLRNRYSSYG